jgi:hypothetical protein
MNCISRMLLLENWNTSVVTEASTVMRSGLSGAYENVLYLDCGSSFMGVCNNENSSDCILEMSYM